MSLAPGASYERDWVVEGVFTTNVRGTLGRTVLSTPAMIGLMEYCATSAVKGLVPEGTTTVGFEVCVKHVAGAPEGATVRVKATLTSVEDARKLHFDVECREGDRVVGVGTHQRRIVGRAKAEDDAVVGPAAEYAAEEEGAPAVAGDAATEGDGSGAAGPPVGDAESGGRSAAT